MDNFEKGWAEMSQGNTYLDEKHEEVCLWLTWVFLALGGYLLTLIALGY